MRGDEEALAPPAKPVLPLHKVFSVGMGNALEFYDFLTFSFFSIQISHTFFPGGEAAHGLLYTLATFGIGFLARPLGGWLLGRYADRAGRRPAMMVSFSLMGVAMLGVALTPSYARIGVAAPLLLVGFRLVQGFALGGEVGPSTAYLVEVAPAHRRGLYVALQYATQDLAIILSGLVGFVLSALLTPADLDDWGWRLAFLLGVSVVPLGVWLRRSLPETLEVAPQGNARARLPLRLLAIGLVLLCVSAICDYVLDYITTYAQDSLKLDAQAAFGATVVLGLAEACADLGAGLLSDRYGRKPVMYAGLLGLVFLVVPVYLAMSGAPSALTAYAGMAVLGMLYPIAGGPMLVSVTESLPMGQRAAALAVLYALAMTVFGGSTQFLVKLLTDASGSALAPAWYMTGALGVALVAGLALPESAPVRLAARPIARQGRSG